MEKGKVVLPVRRTLGQVAHTEHLAVFGGRGRTPWEHLRPQARGRWERIATAVVEELGGPADAE